MSSRRSSSDLLTLPPRRQVQSPILRDGATRQRRRRPGHRATSTAPPRCRQLTGSRCPCRARGPRVDPDRCPRGHRHARQSRTGEGFPRRTAAGSRVPDGRHRAAKPEGARQQESAFSHLKSNDQCRQQPDHCADRADGDRANSLEDLRESHRERTSAAPQIKNSGSHR